MSTDTTAKPATRDTGRMVAVITLVLLGPATLWITYRTGLALTWGSLAAGFGVLLFFPLWCVWVIVAAYLCLRHARGYVQVAARLLLCIGIAIGSLLGSRTLAARTAEATRNREVRHAMDQGLYADCIALLDHWPARQARIFPGEVPLPKSIEVFDPVYITNDTLVSPELGPPNIGLCKNGFGGFNHGIRIFRTDEDAQKCITARGAFGQRIAPGIYYWYEPT